MNTRRTTLAIGLTALASVSAAGAVPAVAQIESTDDRPAHGDRMSMSGRGMGGQPEMRRLMASPEMRKLHSEMAAAHGDSMRMSGSSGMRNEHMR